MNNTSPPSQPSAPSHIPDLNEILNRHAPGWNAPPPPSPPPAPRSSTESDPERRAISYVTSPSVPPAVQGQYGAAQMMRVCRAVCWGFDLGPEIGFNVVWNHYNPRCVPPWTDEEAGDVRRKCRDAMERAKEPRGWLRDAAPDLDTPHRAARPSGPLGDEGDDVPPLAAVVPPASPAATVTALDPPDRPPVLPFTPPAAVPPPCTTGYCRISNYTLRAHRRRDGSIDQEREDRVADQPQAIIRYLLRMTGGWPKAAGGRLFVPGPDHHPVWFKDATDLFAWLALTVGRGGGQVEWGQSEGMLTKAEFFVALASSVEQYDDAQTCPHWPARDRTYYMHPRLPPGGSGRLDELLSRLRPATEADAALIRAFFLTPAWGGQCGARPVFIFEAAGEDGRPGQGAGKSTASMLAGKLFGGYVSLGLRTDDKDVQNRLLSDMGRRSRLVVFDNVKGTGNSSSLIESYVTADVISGKQMWAGEGGRPNVITWIITANQPSLSADFAGRAIPIRIKPPDYSPSWRAEINAFVEQYRWQILADVLALLQAQPVAQLGPGEWSRWSEWEAGVLCKVCDPRTVIPTILERRTNLDSDAEAGEQIRETLIRFISSRKGHEPESCHIEFTPEEMLDAIGSLWQLSRTKSRKEGEMSTIGLGRWLTPVLPHVRGLTRERPTKGTCYVWKGGQAILEKPIAWESLPIRIDD